MSRSSAENVHPLAARLIDAYSERKLSGPVLEIAAGSGRNTRALVDAGIPVVSTRDADPITQLPGGRDLYGAALSTHGLLHGETAKLKLAVGELRRTLAAGAPAYLVLGSIEDARYGLGIPVDERTFAPGEGPEAAIPHAFFDRDGVIELLGWAFEIREMNVVDASATAGRWAHDDDEVGGMRHWFVIADRR